MIENEGGQSENEEIQEQNPQDSAEDVDSFTESEQSAQDLIDLDKIEKARWQGKEYSSKDLKDMFMMRSDYSKKTAEIAKDRRYYENLEADLSAVSENPSLVAKFKEVYPENFHKFLNFVKQSTDMVQKTAEPRSRDSGRENDRIAQLEAKMQQELAKVNKWEKAQQEQQLKAIESEIDSHMERAKSKHADVLTSDSLKNRFELDCITVAKQLYDDGQQLDASTWEKITKAVADDLRSLINVKRSDIVQKQTQANNRGRDVPAGGGIPGSAPRKFRNVREATQAFLDEME